MASFVLFCTTVGTAEADLVFCLSLCMRESRLWWYIVIEIFSKAESIVFVGFHQAHRNYSLSVRNKYTFALDRTSCKADKKL